MAKNIDEKKAHVEDSGASGPQLIDPMWILKMVAGVVIAALICGYLTLGLLFYQGAWQLVLNPTHELYKSAGIGLPNEPVEFAADKAGQPQLGGLWIPAGPPAAYTVLYLRSGHGQLAMDQTDAGNIGLLHAAGLNVLAFDYRGFGSSVWPHPSEARMLEDARWAFDFMTQQRGVQANHVLLWGEGIGAPTAAQLDAQLEANGASQMVAGLILDQPDATALKRVQNDPRGRLLPVSLLFHDRFDLAGPLTRLKAPKLLMQTSEAGVGAMSENDLSVADAFRSAASLKSIVSFLPGRSEGALKSEQLASFLDSWIPDARRTALPLQ